MANEGNALIQPIYNCKHREYIELVDSDGAAIALNTGDTELSKDGAAFTDSAAEMSEISTGFCSIDFPYSEMAYSFVAVVPKSTGALTRIIKLYPRRWPTLTSGTAQAGAAAQITLAAGASATDGAYTGCWVRASNNDPAGIQGEVRKISGYTGSTKVATISPNWDNNPTSSTTYEILVPDDLALASMTASAADVVDEMETQMAADPTGFKMNVMEVNGQSQTANDNGADINDILTDTSTGVTIADGHLVAAKFGADCITNAKIANDAIAAENIKAAAITAAKLGADCITSAKIANDAIATEHLKADAVTKIATGVSTGMTILKNSATRDLFFTMRDSTDHNLTTGLTVAGQVNIDGAGFGAVTGAITEVALGWYKLAAHATDRNGNMIIFHFTATGCDPTPLLMVTGN